MITRSDHVGVYGKFYSDKLKRKQADKMEVSHTTDGYWVLSGYLSETPSESAQAMMRKAKEQFIKANPLIDASKVVVVTGEFKQASFYQSIYKAVVSKDLASMIIDGANQDENYSSMMKY